MSYVRRTRARFVAPDLPGTGRASYAQASRRWLLARQRRKDYLEEIERLQAILAELSGERHARQHKDAG
ncbi:MAG: hypothetical protein JWL64_1322 [Frankiales bacterium]|nr:hypothetical protein [Frankiales bacterium]